MEWTGKRVLVTGGASFIGSHLTDALVARGAVVRIVDDLSSGRLAISGIRAARGRAAAVGTCVMASHDTQRTPGPAALLP